MQVHKSLFLTLLVIVLVLGCVKISIAQHAAGNSTAPKTVAITPESTDITVGQKIKFKAVVTDSAGRTTPAAASSWFAAPFDLAGVDQSGMASFFNPGEVVIGAIVAGRSAFVTVTVKPAPVVHIDIEPLKNALVVGTTARLNGIARTSAGNPRTDVTFAWSSSNPDVAVVDAAGVVTAIAPGQAKVTAVADKGNGVVNVTVINSNLSGLSIEPRSTQARIGDVVHFNVHAQSGAADNYSVRWTVSGPAATIDPDGGFVAETPGSYVVTASSGNQEAVASILITPRNAERKLEVVGRAP